VRGADNLNHLQVPIVLISGVPNLLEPSGPVQACNGIALPLSSQSTVLNLKIILLSYSLHVSNLRSHHQASKYIFHFFYIFSPDNDPLGLKVVSIIKLNMVFKLQNIFDIIYNDKHTLQKLKGITCLGKNCPSQQKADRQIGPVEFTALCDLLISQVELALCSKASG
jgi:hypothetical protein